MNTANTLTARRVIERLIESPAGSNFNGLRALKKSIFNASSGANRVDLDTDGNLIRVSLYYDSSIGEPDAANSALSMVKRTGLEIEGKIETDDLDGDGTLVQLYVKNPQVKHTN